MEYLSLRDEYFLFIICFSRDNKTVRSVWRRLSECSQGMKQSFTFFSNDRHKGMPGYFSNLFRLIILKQILSLKYFKKTLLTVIIIIQLLFDSKV